jgi:hypothetical protein
MPSRLDRAVIRRLAPLGLMPAAAFAVHQLRYLLAFGGHAGLMLERQGHAYLHSLAPSIALLVALVVGGFLRELGRAFSGQRSAPRYALSFTVLWLTCSACLVAIYLCQELLEGLLATGHPAGLAGVLGYGGWWAIPASLCVGLVLAAVFHGARWAIQEISDRRAAFVQSTPAPSRPRLHPICLPAAPLEPLADGWSGRGPPS